MRKKPELLVTAGTINESVRMIDAGADAINIGSNHYGVRLPGDMSLSDIRDTVKIAHDKQIKVYVSVNNIIDNAQLSTLPSYLEQLCSARVDALIFGDPAVLMTLREMELRLPLHWNTEMTSTNYATANYWGNKGATRVVLARELNLEEIHEVKRNTKLEVQVQVHGITNIYHSKRRLIQSYMDHIQVKSNLELMNMNGGAKDKLFLVEQERKELKLPIYEDDNGTHIMSAEDICMIENLEEILEEDIDSLKIEGLLKSIEYNETVVRAYRQAIDSFCADPMDYKFDPELLEQIKQVQDKDRELTYGFFFKEQVY